jgi:ABC-type multidrug transport system fused ATPase/permease subunit
LRTTVQPHALSGTPEGMQALRGSIKFIDVSYSYTDGWEVFKHLFFDIPAGQPCPCLVHPVRTKRTDQSVVAPG